MKNNNQNIKQTIFKIKTLKKKNIDFLDVREFGKKFPNHSLTFFEHKEEYISLKHHFETKTNTKKALDYIKNQLKTYKKAYNVEILPLKD